jgi:molecular chaperone HtpG
MEEKGTISIHTENIFPIIKKFLYSDHEIFLRELVANAMDASQKLKSLSSLGEFKGELGELSVRVNIDKEAKTLTISDNGIGMTADEIKKYINQIAFSGASEFVEKYKDSADAQQIIGHFGLGFYSAFMVSARVEIQTLSYKDGSAPAFWSCTGETDFIIGAGSRTERGTDIVLHLAEDSLEFLEDSRVRGILDKYCRFLPIPIYFGEEIINDTQPIWTRQPADLKEEDYLQFYRTLYPMSEDPLFWIHLNVDYPFNLTGVLYFPKLKRDFEVQKNKIKLYSRQVFITDEVKDVVPEFLMLLHGVLDSPDIPLNVSRSYLQADSNVKKINSHITKKVADRLDQWFRENRAAYAEKWDDIGIFVKYGMLSDEKFEEKARKFCLLKDTEGTYHTPEEYRTAIAPLQTDKDGKVIGLYTSDAEKQDAYITQALRKDYKVLVLDSIIDSHFSSKLEGMLEQFQLKRVDSESVERLIPKTEALESILSKDEQETITENLKKLSGNDRLMVKTEALSAEDWPLSLVFPEFMRRMMDMNMGMGGALNQDGFYEVIINGNHPLWQQYLKNSDEEKERTLQQVWDLGRLAQGRLAGKDLTRFIDRSLSWVKS